MSRCVIICAGEYAPISFAPKKDDFVICCDAGYKAAEAMGIKPDLIMGDFDSYGGRLPEDIPIMRYPVEKDDTDSMLAVREGLKRGYKDFVLLFALGGRLDHTFANVQTLAFMQQHGADGVLIGPRDTVRLLTNGTLTLKRDESRTFSIFAFGQTARGVTLTGMQYPLDHAEITQSFPIGLGNHILEPQGTVTVTDGTLIVIESEIN